MNETDPWDPCGTDPRIFRFERNSGLPRGYFADEVPRWRRVQQACIALAVVAIIVVIVVIHLQGEIPQ